MARSIIKTTTFFFPLLKEKCGSEEVVDDKEETYLEILLALEIMLVPDIIMSVKITEIEIIFTSFFCFFQRKEKRSITSSITVILIMNWRNEIAGTLS